ncbi:STE3-like pheromone receptor, partial [Lyophyllum atratum]
MADPSYPVFSIFSFIGFVLVLIPLPWHLQAWNSGTCLFMIWTAIGCLNLFINSIIWHNNAIDWSPLWCDISTRLVVGTAVAIPAASLCIKPATIQIASGTTVSLTREHVDGICHRYDIWEDIGCFPTTVNTPAAYPLSFVWPNVIGLISAHSFSEFLSSNSTLTVNRYFRLMALATVELLFNTPISTFGLYLNAVLKPIYPWKNWADIHFDWYTIDTFPAVLWRSSRIEVVSLELSRWLVVLCAFTFFAFFGFADESRKHYRLAYWAVAKRFGVVPPSPSPSSFHSSVGVSAYLRTLPTSTTSPRTSFASSVARNSYDKSDYTASIYQSPPEYKVDLN